MMQAPCVLTAPLLASQSFDLLVEETLLMPLNADSLLSITEKNFVREYQWTPDDKIALLTGRDRELSFVDTQPSKLAIDFVAELDQGAGSFVVAKNGIFGLTRESLSLYSWDHEGTHFQAKKAQELILCSPGQSHRTLLARVPPSLGLQLEPRERWLSWISDSGREQEVQTYSPKRKDQKITSVLRVPGFLRNVRWHPHSSLFLYISWGIDQVSWEDAELFLGEYQNRQFRPLLKSTQLIKPPAQTHAVKMSCSEAHFSPCGNYIIALLRSGEWFQFWSLHLGTGLWTQLSQAAMEHAKPPRAAELPQFALHPSHPFLIGIGSRKGKSHFARYNYAQKTESEAWKAPRTRDTWLDQPRFSSQGHHFSVITASSQHQPSLRSWQYDDASWYESASMRLKPSYLSESLIPTLIEWPSFDQHIVHGIFYHSKKATKPLPLIIAIHGGPVEQVVASWPAKAKYFVELGFALLYVNYRGSWGYGTAYQQALAGQWGLKDSEDVASAIPYLTAQGLIDPNRVGLWGGAAGGLTALNTLNTYPKLAKAAVAVHPYLDLPDLLSRCAPLKRSELLWGLGDSSTQDLHLRSPLHQYSNIVSKVALFHGAQDTLVPVKQCEQLCANLMQQGVACDFKIYADEGHGWQLEATRFDYGRRVTDFFMKHLQ